jgi:hypothetical protein
MAQNVLFFNCICLILQRYISVKCTEFSRNSAKSVSLNCLSCQRLAKLAQDLGSLDGVYMSHYLWRTLQLITRTNCESRFKQILPRLRRLQPVAAVQGRDSPIVKHYS